jgi:hypothetical protein
MTFGRTIGDEAQPAVGSHVKLEGGDHPADRPRTQRGASKFFNDSDEVAFWSARPADVVASTSSSIAHLPVLERVARMARIERPTIEPDVATITALLDVTLRCQVTLQA